jgi:glutamate-ammonia-ligase adenylyltransferase
MVEDRQTHELPKTAEAMDNVARLHGLEDGAALLDLLRPHVQWVGSNYDRLTPAGEAESLSQDQERLKVQLAGLGFADAETPATRIARWRAGTIRALRSGA